MPNPKKVIKVIKTAKKAAKKKETPKQKTYKIRGALAKRDRELEAGDGGGKASPEFIAKLRRQTFPHLYE
jgi:hypothetical protein